jgi:cephalosporin-C deacetylase-like acetyl esterase
MKRKMLPNLAALLLVTAGPFASADEANPKSAVYLNIAMDHEDASYVVGEPVTWTIKVSGIKTGAPTFEPTYAVRTGTNMLAKGTLHFADGAAKVTGQLDHPGVIELKVDHSTQWRSEFRCGAAVGWTEIRSTVPEPADFDAFWTKKLAELAAVPMNPVLEEADSSSPDVLLWKITLDSFRDTKVHGYLARPKGTGPLPAQLQVQYWGLYPLNKNEVVGIAKKGWLAMNIMAHDLPCDRDAAFYKEADKTGKFAVGNGADDPEKSYFLRMFLSCSRAVDYLAGRSDWNMSALLVQSGSQGGFQGLATAGLNPKVTALTVFVPGGCDLTGSLEGRPNGWPGWVGSFAKGAERDAKIKTAGYFDAKNFAKRIKCPVLVGTGLLDSIAKPETQFAMFNNITSPKRMVILPEDEHISPHTEYKAVQNAWWKAAATGEPLPTK